jgi:hypothetical protein
VRYGTGKTKQPYCFEVGEGGVVRVRRHLGSLERPKGCTRAVVLIRFLLFVGVYFLGLRVHFRYSPQRWHFVLHAR